jgi:hypothetical protein
MTRRDKDSTKKPIRVNYTALNSRCPLCMRLFSKSKKFGTPYHLQYHLRDHNSDDENSTGISILDVRQTVNHICKAIGWRMFFDSTGVRHDQ